MQAILYKAFGGPEVLYMEEVPTPVPGEEEILVKVLYAGINRADILQRKGHYPPPPGSSPILGLEVSGIVEQVGERVDRWKPGDRVCALLSGGGYAEYAVIHQRMVMPVPPGVSLQEAAAIPEAFLTGYQALFWIGNLQSGQWVLIHAGGSGVGTASIQLAREAGAYIVVTAGSENKLAVCRELGAELAINYKIGPFASPVLEHTGTRGVDVILDFVGQPYWEQNLAVLAPDGILVILSLLGGSKIENFDLSILMKKRLRIQATTLRNRSPEYKMKLTEEFSRFALKRFTTGQLKAVIDRVFPWEQVAEAHRYMEANRNTGKILLQVSRGNLHNRE
ncbi:MAG: NAD(P)H-quinone oxidoreductase [Calditrichia bacterium]